jgi:hypothetical protein
MYSKGTTWRCFKLKLKEESYINHNILKVTSIIMHKRFNHKLCSINRHNKEHLESAQLCFWKGI